MTTPSLSPTYGGGEIVPLFPAKTRKPAPPMIRLAAIGPAWVIVAHRVRVDAATDGWAWRLSWPERDDLLRGEAEGLFVTMQRRGPTGAWEIVAARTPLGVARKAREDARLASIMGEGEI